MSPGMTETAGAARAGREFGDDGEFGSHHRHDDQLGVRSPMSMVNGAWPDSSTRPTVRPDNRCRSGRPGCPARYRACGRDRNAAAPSPPGRGRRCMHQQTGGESNGFRSDGPSAVPLGKRADPIPPNRRWRKRVEESPDPNGGSRIFSSMSRWLTVRHSRALLPSWQLSAPLPAAITRRDQRDQLLPQQSLLSQQQHPFPPSHSTCNSFCSLPKPLPATPTRFAAIGPDSCDGACPGVVQHVVSFGGEANRERPVRNAMRPPPPEYRDCTSSRDSVSLVF